MQSHDDMFEDMFTAALQDAANEPVPKIGSTFNLPSVTVYTDMPKLKPFDAKLPIDRNAFAQQHLTRVPPSHNLPIRTYANEYYAFSWNEPRPGNVAITVYAESAKNLFKIKDLFAYKPGHPDAFKYPVKIAPPPYAMRGNGILDDCRAQRIVLIHTLLDLNEIMRREYGMRVLTAQATHDFTNAYWGRL